MRPGYDICNALLLPVVLMAGVLVWRPARARRGAGRPARRHAFARTSYCSTGAVPAARTVTTIARGQPRRTTRLSTTGPFITAGGRLAPGAAVRMTFRFRWASGKLLRRSWPPIPPKEAHDDDEELIRPCRRFSPSPRLPPKTRERAGSIRWSLRTTESGEVERRTRLAEACVNLSVEEDWICSGPSGVDINRNACGSWWGRRAVCEF